MIKNIAKKSLVLALLAGIGFSAVAQERVYLIDQRDVVAKSGFGLCWRTGYWTPAMAVAECDPELAKTSEGKDGAKAATPKPAAVKVTLAADALFDFDKAVLRPEGKAKLDDVVAKMKDIKLEVIIAVGHADRIGTPKYNQRLSERRAAAIKSYLVGKGVADNRVYTEGKGEKQPVASNATKEGRQKNRRVEIEVIGTKKP